MERKHSTDECGRTCLRKALKYALALSKKKVLVMHPAGIFPKQGRRAGRRSPGDLMYPQGLTFHTFSELVMPIEGRGLLFLQDESWPLEAGEVAIVCPGMAHCEACRREAGSYCAMWMIPTHDMVLTLFSSWRSDSGWGIPYHGYIKGAMAARICAILGESDLWRDSHTEWQISRLQAAMLTGLAVLHEKEVGRSMAVSLPGANSDWKKQAIVESVKSHIESHLSEVVSLRDLGVLVGLSPRYLNHLFREQTGETTHRYMARRRMEKALVMCRDSSLRVKEIAAATGFRDPLYFSRVFKQHTGVSVTLMRKLMHVKSTQ